MLVCLSTAHTKEGIYTFLNVYDELDNWLDLNMAIGTLIMDRAAEFVDLEID